MLVAELFGKLSVDNFSLDLEDLLTAEVFGSLRYLPPRYLAAVLKRARAMNPGTVLDGVDVTELAARTDVRFWPSLSLREGGAVRLVEPDVTLSTPRLTVVIECKFGAPLDAEQLARELVAAAQVDPGSDVCILAVSASRTRPRMFLGCPSAAVRTAHRHAVACGLAHDEAWVRSRLAWLDWRDITAALEHVIERPDAGSGEAAHLCEDLLELLYLRGLRPFGGFPQALAARPPAHLAVTGPVFLDPDGLPQARAFGGFPHIATRRIARGRPVFLAAAGSPRPSAGRFRGFPRVAFRPVHRPNRWRSHSRFSGFALTTTERVPTHAR